MADIVNYIFNKFLEGKKSLFKFYYLNSFSINNASNDEEDLANQTFTRRSTSISCHGIVTKDNEMFYEMTQDFCDEKLLTHIQKTFETASKIGFLKLYETGWMKDQYNEYFFMLSDIGLIYFDDMSSLNCKGFFPILGANVTEILQDFNKNQNYVMKITYPKVSFNVKLAGYSIIQIKEWIHAIQKVQTNIYSQVQKR